VAKCRGIRVRAGGRAADSPFTEVLDVKRPGGDAYRTQRWTLDGEAVGRRGLISGGTGRA